MMAVNTVYTCVLVHVLLLEYSFKLNSVEEYQAYCQIAYVVVYD